MRLPYKIIIYSFIVIALITGCNKDYLDRPSLSTISADNFYKTKEDLRLATAALYGGRLWGDWTYTSYLPVGEVLSGNMILGYWGDAVQLNTFSITSQNGITSANWNGMYNIVAQCNTTIKAINDYAPSSIATTDKNAATAEARFLRGFAYYNLAILWGDVPIIEDNTKLIASPLIYRNKTEDVYRFAVNDLRFAVKNLPSSDVAGRLTTWSAQGMLAKVYLTWAGYHPEGNGGSRDQALLDSAKLYAGNVCKNSGRKLIPNYADLFKVQNNDNEESLFALQWAAGNGWLDGNMLQIYSSGGNAISASGNDAGWFAFAATYDLYKQYTKKDSIRRKATIMLKGDHYPELNRAGGGFTYTGDSGLKKHIVGTRVDNNAPTMNNTSSPEHNALLRLADVYLIYVEAILGNNTSTSDVDAVKYFNAVQTRAGLDPLATITADTLRWQRRIELACEGHHWEDLIRLSYSDPTKAAGILNTQIPNRVTLKYDNNSGVGTKGDGYGAITPANSGTFKFPIPSADVTANPKLSEEPIPYSF